RRRGRPSKASEPEEASGPDLRNFAGPSDLVVLPRLPGAPMPPVPETGRPGRTRKAPRNANDDLMLLETLRERAAGQKAGVHDVDLTKKRKLKEQGGGGRKNIARKVTSEDKRGRREWIQTRVNECPLLDRVCAGAGGRGRAARGGGRAGDRMGSSSRCRQRGDARWASNGSEGVLLRSPACAPELEGAEGRREAAGGRGTVWDLAVVAGDVGTRGGRQTRAEECSFFRPHVRRSWRARKGGARRREGGGPYGIQQSLQATWGRELEDAEGRREAAEGRGTVWDPAVIAGDVGTRGERQTRAEECSFFRPHVRRSWRARKGGARRREGGGPYGIQQSLQATWGRGVGVKRERRSAPSSTRMCAGAGGRGRAAQGGTRAGDRMGSRSRCGRRGDARWASNESGGVPLNFPMCAPELEGAEGRREAAQGRGMRSEWWGVKALGSRGKPWKLQTHNRGGGAVGAEQVGWGREGWDHNTYKHRLLSQCGGLLQGSPGVPQAAAGAITSGTVFIKRGMSSLIMLLLPELQRKSTQNGRRAGVPPPASAPDSVMAGQRRLWSGGVGQRGRPKKETAL
ncbi:hypothetical protein DFH09DRAFT_1097012, partial [Mycena vulgaris]